jgi:glutamyl-tRNA reductase
MIVCLGLSHHRAPLALREQFGFAQKSIAPALTYFIQQDAVSEVLIVSTCHRVEVYAFCEEPAALLQRWCDYKQVPLKTLQDYVYCHQGVDAVEHLMQVACGLDSRMLGESDILGQLKLAYADACLQKTVGPRLNALLQMTFALAKRVRKSTKIGACSVSVASTASRYMTRWLQAQQRDQKEQRVLLLGAGRTATLLAQYLRAFPRLKTVVVSRSHARAQQLANDYGMQAGAMLDLEALLAASDVVFTATSCSDQVITKVMLSASYPALWLDLASPRDIDPDIAHLPGVTLYNLDHFKDEINASLQVRQHAAKQAALSITLAARDVMLSLRALDGGQLITRYRTQVEQVRQSLLEDAVERLRQGQSAEQVCHDFSQKLAKQLMHSPCTYLHQATKLGQHDLLQQAQALLGMEEDVIA